MSEYFIKEKKKESYWVNQTCCVRPEVRGIKSFKIYEYVIHWCLYRHLCDDKLLFVRNVLFCTCKRSLFLTSPRYLTLPVQAVTRATQMADRHHFLVTRILLIFHVFYTMQHACRASRHDVGLMDIMTYRTDWRVRLFPNVEH